MTPRGCIHFFANRNVKAGTMTIQNAGDFCFNSAHRSSEPPLDAKISKRTHKKDRNKSYMTIGISSIFLNNKSFYCCNKVCG